MPGPTNPAVGGQTLPPISGTPFVDGNGILTVSGLNLLQQLWAGVFGTYGVAEQFPQPGDIKPVAGAMAQSGWLICDGSTYQIADYQNLYTAIGTTWGSGGTGTFKVPNLQGIFVIGADGTYTLGSTGGALSATIEKANLPLYNLDTSLTWSQSAASSNKLGGANPGSPVSVTSGADFTVVPESDMATQTITVTGTVSGSVSTGGSGTALDTTPAYAAVNWLIKF